MCRGCCEYDVIRCKCPLQGTPVGYAVPCCRNAINECDPCIIHPGIWCGLEKNSLTGGTFLFQERILLERWVQVNGCVCINTPDNIITCCCTYELQQLSILVVFVLHVPHSHMCVTLSSQHENTHLFSYYFLKNFTGKSSSIADT